MKKVVSIILVLCLCLTLCGCNPKDILSSLLPKQEDAYMRDAKIYNDYLINGGIDELAKEWLEYSEPENLKINTCLLDFNDDNCYELYVSIAGDNDIRDYVHTDALLAIKDDEVKIIKSAMYLGGTIDGESLDLYYDTETEKYVLLYLSWMRDGGDYGVSTRNIYTYDGNDIVTLKSLFTSHTNLAAGYPEYNAEADKIKKETNLYKQDGDVFQYYKIDDEYVSEEDFNNALECYIIPEDENYKLKEGTLDNPLNLEEDTDTSSDESEIQSTETSSIESEETVTSQETPSTPTPSKTSDTTNAEPLEIAEKLINYYAQASAIGICCDGDFMWEDLSRFLTDLQKENYFSTQYEITCCHSKEDIHSHLLRYLDESIINDLSLNEYYAKNLFCDDKNNWYMSVPPMELGGYDNISITEYSNNKIVAYAYYYCTGDIDKQPTIFTIEKRNGNFVLTNVKQPDN